MNHVVPAHFAPASRLLDLLQSAMGSHTQLRYGNDCLQLAYSSPASNAVESLRAAGAELEGSVSMPGGGDVHFGRMGGAQFLIQSQHGTDGTITSVQIYVCSGKEAQRGARLDAIYRIVDTLLSRHNGTDAALTGYIARRLMDQSDPTATQAFAATMAELLADHLKSALPPLDDALIVRG